MDELKGRGDRRFQPWVPAANGYIPDPLKSTNILIRVLFTSILLLNNTAPGTYYDSILLEVLRHQATRTAILLLCVLFSREIVLSTQLPLYISTPRVSVLIPYSTTVVLIMIKLYLVSCILIMWSQAILLYGYDSYLQVLRV